MPAPRYDVARAFINGKEAANSTKSFRSVYEFGHFRQDAGGKMGDFTTVFTTLYTYAVPLAVRRPDGTIYLPTHDGRANSYDPLRENLHRHYSQTSTIHQNAVKVILEHPNFGDWRKSA